VSLDELRKQIDATDAELVRLVNERARLAVEIGKLKRSGAGPVYVPSRERAVYERVLGRNAGPLSDASLQAIWREIMSASLALEEGARVSYLGPPGTFTHKAAISKFGRSVEYRSAATVRDVFLEVARGHADHGIVPIENSTEGGVNQTIDCFMETSLKVCSEIYVSVHHHLLAKSRETKVKKICSHPQVFGQCREHLSVEWPEIHLVETPSTAAAAEMAAREEGTAAIGSDVAAEIYGLEVLESAIEDNPDNVTRFFVLGRTPGVRTGRDKTSLMFSIRDEVGALYTMLEPFRENRLNLTRIESRPSKRRAWDYVFFVDLEGHSLDEPVRTALDALASRCKMFEILGSYPAASREPTPEARAVLGEDEGDA